jgi:hypothetical protein
MSKLSCVNLSSFGPMVLDKIYKISFSSKHVKTVSLILATSYPLGP